jgi:hypothetical protein
VTLKSGRWGMPSLHPKEVSERKNFLEEKQIK